MYPDESRSLENLRHMRLMALLRDMIDAEGGEKAAQVSGCQLQNGVPDHRVGQADRADERRVGAAPAAGGRLGCRPATGAHRGLEKRVGELEEGLGRASKSFVKVDRERDRWATGGEQAQGLRQLERRLAKVEANGASGLDGRGSGMPVENPAVKPAWRPYRDLVTLEPEPGEEQVYGDATPLIVEWRKVRAEFLDAEDGLSRAIAEERMRELEIELIGERELTLPPRTYPWDGSDRRDEVWRRTQALERARVERARAQIRRWIRRVLTLGLWRD